MTQNSINILIAFAGFVMILAIYRYHYPKLSAIERKGIEGENKLYKTLKQISGEKKILRNLYFFHQNRSSEIDMVFIHETGVYVLESKYYKGIVKGEFEDSQWSHINGSIQRNFYNPAMQNRRHVNEIKKHLESNGYTNVPVWSVVVFADNTDIVMQNRRENNVYVCKQQDIKQYVRGNQKLMKNKAFLTKTDITNIRSILRPLTKVSAWKKRKHIKYAKKMATQSFSRA